MGEPIFSVMFPRCILSFVILCISSGSLQCERWNYAVFADLSSPALEFREAIRRSDVVAFTGFFIQRDGSVASRTVPAWFQDMKRHTKLYPLVSFRDKATGQLVLRNSEPRKKAIRSLLDVSASFDGVHLDFEYLDGKDSVFLRMLLEDLYPKMQAADRNLSLAIFPENFPADYARFHDLAQIGNLADQFVLMTYDYHRPSTSPGPVTDLQWAEEGIKLALRHVPGRKLWLGVPTYGYAWIRNSRRFRTLGEKAFRRLLNCPGGSVRRHKSGTLLVACPASDGRNAEEAYFPDSELHRKMEELAAKYQLSGTAYWRLGID